MLQLGFGEGGPHLALHSGFTPGIFEVGQCNASFLPIVLYYQPLCYNCSYKLVSLITWCWSSLPSGQKNEKGFCNLIDSYCLLWCHPTGVHPIFEPLGDRNSAMKPCQGPHGAFGAKDLDFSHFDAVCPWLGKIRPTFKEDSASLSRKSTLAGKLSL